MSRHVTVCCGFAPQLVGTVVTGAFFRCPRCLAGSYLYPVEVVRRRKRPAFVPVGRRSVR